MDQVQKTSLDRRQLAVKPTIKTTKCDPEHLHICAQYITICFPETWGQWDANVFNKTRTSVGMSLTHIELKTSLEICDIHGGPSPSKQCNLQCDQGPSFESEDLFENLQCKTNRRHSHRNALRGLSSNIQFDCIATGDQPLLRATLVRAIQNKP